MIKKIQFAIWRNIRIYHRKYITFVNVFHCKSNFTKSGYFPIPVCPKTTQEWQASSQRLNCNDTHKYHCAPYYDLSELYEFCYERRLLKVKKGKLSYMYGKHTSIFARTQTRTHTRDCAKWVIVYSSIVIL